MAIPGAPARSSSSPSRSVREARQRELRQDRSSPSTKEADKPKPGKDYTVKSGDSLWKIAKEAYGDGSRWRDIAEANPAVVGHEGHIQAGAKISIPAGAEDRLVQQQARPNVTGGPTADRGAAAQGQPAPAADPGLQRDLATERQKAHQRGARAFEKNQSAEGGQRRRRRAQPKQAEPAEESGPRVFDNDRAVNGGGGKIIRNDSRMQDISRQRGARTFDRQAGWLDDKNDVADEAQEDKKVTSTVVAKATLAQTGKGIEDEVAKVSTSRRLGENGEIGAEAYALRGRAEYSAAAGVDLKNKQIVGDLSGRVEGKVAGATASAASGQYGNDKIHGETSVNGEVFVGAEATGHARVAIDRKGVTASGGVDAFAGAKARADVHQSVGLMGEDIGSVGGRGEVYAGVGAKANGSVGFRDGRLKVSGELGAALGVGAGVALNVDIDVKGALNAGKNAANAAGDAITDGVGSVKKLFGW